MPKTQMRITVGRMVLAVWPTVVCACGIKSASNFPAWTARPDQEIEPLPVVITASFARGDDVYLGLDDGQIVRAKDSDFSQPFVLLGRPQEKGARMVFASSAGDVFCSANGQPVYRLPAGGTDWELSLGVPVWRMEEDDQGNLYAGNYTKDSIHLATLFKSSDRGQSWFTVFQNSENHHIHTVRWFDLRKRLYISWGDRDTRGQAYSDDRGGTWNLLAFGPKEGHTDVGFSKDYIFWGSDDASGRLFRGDHSNGLLESLTSGGQYIWFCVAEANQVFVGTMTSDRNGGDRASLLVSSDQGRNWTKLMETSPSTKPYSRGFIAESRQLSAGRWLYFSECEADGLKSFRVRINAP